MSDAHAVPRRRASLWWIALLVIGVAILVLPDDGARVVSLNTEHGPSRQDLVGIALIVLSWARLVTEVVMRRRAVYQRIGSTGVVIALGAIVAGAGLIGGGLAAESNPALYSGIGTSLVGYAALVMPALGVRAESTNTSRPERSKSR